MFWGLLSSSAPLNISACQKILNVVIVYIVEILSFFGEMMGSGAGSTLHPRDLKFFVVDTWGHSNEKKLLS